MVSNNFATLPLFRYACMNLESFPSMCLMFFEVTPETDTNRKHKNVSGEVLGTVTEVLVSLPPVTNSPPVGMNLMAQLPTSHPYALHKKNKGFYIAFFLAFRHLLVP
jgi:hypothetical protein